MIVNRLKYAVLNEVVLCQARFEGSHSVPTQLCSGRALIWNPVLSISLDSRFRGNDKASFEP